MLSAAYHICPSPDNYQFGARTRLICIEAGYCRHGVHVHDRRARHPADVRAPPSGHQRERACHLRAHERRHPRRHGRRGSSHARSHAVPSRSTFTASSSGSASALATRSSRCSSRSSSTTRAAGRCSTRATVSADGAPDSPALRTTVCSVVSSAHVCSDASSVTSDDERPMMTPVESAAYQRVTAPGHEESVSSIRSSSPGARGCCRRTRRTMARCSRLFLPHHPRRFVGVLLGAAANIAL